VSSWPDAAARRENPDPSKLADYTHHFDWVAGYKSELAAHLRTRIERLET